MCTAPFWLDALDGVPPAFRYALAFLAFLQVTAALLNMLPVPGLDGYGVVEPWLSYGVKRRIEPYAPYGFFVVIALLFVPAVNGAFFDAIDALMRALGVPEQSRYCGSELFRFWEGTPGVLRGLSPARAAQTWAAQTWAAAAFSALARRR